MMALVDTSPGSWFSNWQPPTDFLPDVQSNAAVGGNTEVAHFPIQNKHDADYGHRGRGGSSPNMLSLITFLASLGLIDPDDNVHFKNQLLGSHHRNFKNDDRDYGGHVERTGPFRTVYAWKQLDYAFPSEYERTRAINTGEYIRENNLPLGLEIYKDKVFVTMPKWKPGTPATLAVLPKVPKEKAPKLVPYPNWEYHTTEACWGLTSVFRIQADSCDRLWVLDSGQIDVTIKPNQVCPPQIFIFDLKTDELVLRYELPEEFIKQDSLYSNIIVDERDGDCEDVHAYLADVWRYGLVVFSLKKVKSWRVTDHLFYPDPLAAAYNLHGLKFEWTDGIFSLALGPTDPITKDRLLYFHPMSSFRECFVKTSIICNETGWENSKDGFQVIGESRGPRGHASAAAMDRNGVLYYNLVSKDAIGCWDSRKPYKKMNHGIIVKNSTTLIFPNDMKVDRGEPKESVWVLTNRLPFYLYRGLDPDVVNFRIMRAYTDEAVKGTICDPDVSHVHTFDPVEDGADCF